MKETIAVVDSLNFAKDDSFYLSSLKRLALMFNRLAIPHLSEGIFSNKQISTKHPRFISELQWLTEKNIVFEPNLDSEAKISDSEYKKLMDLSLNHTINLAGLVLGFDINQLESAKTNKRKFQMINKKLYRLEQMTGEELMSAITTQEFLKNLLLTTSHSIRAYCIQLREVQNIDAFPILPFYIPNAEESNKKKNHIVQITLKLFPIPDESTSWEQIIDFRNDPDSYHKFLALRNWMNDTSKGDFTQIEIEQKLEYLLDQYQQHMKLHRMKTNTGTLETIVTTSAEVLGDLISFKWGKAAKALFALRNRKIELLDGELKSPGNEVAYIIKTQEYFRN